MNALISLTITLAPLLFGLIAWGLSAACLFSRQSRGPLSIASWCFCACSLWFPLYSIHTWVQGNDIAAILDCTHAYLLCASVLLVVNLLLTIIGTLLKQKS